MVLSFLVARGITHHPLTIWRATPRLQSEVTVVAIRLFFSLLYVTFLTVFHSEKHQIKTNLKSKRELDWYT